MIGGREGNRKRKVYGANDPFRKKIKIFKKKKSKKSKIRGFFVRMRARKTKI